MCEMRATGDLRYERGRYGSVINYAKPPHPPLPEQEATWAQELIAHIQKAAQ